MSVLYRLDKDNMVADALSRMTMGSVSHVEEPKKELGKMFIGLLASVLCWKIIQMGVIWSIITPSHHWWLR